ncbi:MAG: response regulator transcription factor [Chloroflexota bacterium]|nr:response regulator transcription factor [Chloroflexota bacterium]
MTLSTGKTLLVVDDKLAVRALLLDYLSESGYRVILAANGREALTVARQHKPDLILLDVMMPEMDGFAFLEAYRKERETPVILLTAKIEETDKVAGLELGADDYITKPFGMAELVARVRAVLRRADKTAEETRVCVGAVTLDEDTRRVTVEDRRVDLTPTEFALLACMMRAPGRVFNRLDLLETLKGDTLDGSERTIDVHIRNLRAKIESDSANPRWIETVFGVGYRFSAEG